MVKRKMTRTNNDLKNIPIKLKLRSSNTNPTNYEQFIEQDYDWVSNDQFSNPGVN